MKYKILALLLTIVMVAEESNFVIFAAETPGGDANVIEELGDPIFWDDLKESETEKVLEIGRELYSVGQEKQPLLDDAATDKIAPVKNYPIEITGDANSEFNAEWTFTAAKPAVVTFLDYKGYLNVAYMDGEYLKIQRYDKDMSLKDQLSIPLSYSRWGNVTCDDEGYYYVVWGQADADVKNCVTISVKKYDYQGKFLAECAYKGYDTWDSYWGTKTAFYAGNCSMTINNGVLAVNYAREMYSGHQSNYIIYVDCKTMTALEGADAYCSHSFDQRIISLSDGGYLALNHGDAFYRSFQITKINSNRNYVHEIKNFHFREGANRDHGYNETYAQLGGIVETDNAFIFCASSERTLSVETAPTNQEYCGYSEARDLFLQFYNKDLSRTACRVEGETRVATGTKPDKNSVLTNLYLDGTEVDYGVVWLTDYEDSYYVANPKIVSIGNGQVAVLWEKRTYAEHKNVGTYYAVLDENGNVIKQPLRLLEVQLAGNIDPIYYNGNIYWATSDTNGDYIHVLNPRHEAENWVKVTGVKIDNSEIDVYYGETIQLKASVLPENANYQGLQYESSNPWIASVDQEGNITGEWYGTATITVTSEENSDCKATCLVNVMDYSIAYNLNGGENHFNNPYRYNITTETIELWDASREGYIFAGWYSDSDYKTKVTQIPKGSTGDKTLYAKWIPQTPDKIANVVSGVHVYWKAIGGADKYGLWRSENGKNGEYKWIANPSVAHFTDTSVESGKTYYYKITAYDASTKKHSDKSEAIGITYVATPDITSRVNKAAGVSLGWNKVNGATGYAIYRKSYNGNDAWVRVGTIPGNSNFTWTDDSVKNENGTVYKYTIRALAGSNMKTLSGCRNAGRTMARLSSRILNSATKINSTSVKCKWSTSSAVNGYEVRFMVGNKVEKTYTIGNYKTGTKTFTGLKAGQTYKVQVRSYKKVDGVGSFYSAWSTAKNVSLK